MPTIRVGGTTYSHDVAEPAVPDDADGENVRLAFIFNTGAGLTSFKIRTDMTRSALVAPPVVLERRYVALS